MSTKSNKSSNKSLIYTSVLLVSIMVLIFALKQFGLIGESNSEIEVETTYTKYATITQKVSASGNIQPEVEVIIRPDVSGEIIELAVQEGDFVREGDLLVRIKPDIYQARIDNLNAALLTQKARMEQTRAALIQAEATYIRDKELFDKKNIDPGGVVVTSKGSNSDFVSRYFVPQCSFFEDPVTGSTHCSLVPYWSEKLGKNELKSIQLSERGGEMFCIDKGDRVLINGQAKTYFKGTVAL